MAMKCPQCRKSMPLEATAHVCGWRASATLPGVEAPPPVRPHIDCAMAQCPQNATVRVWTPTGWANVCPEHYGSVERALRPSTSQAVKEIRAAYEKSPMYLRKLGPPAPERIPGEDREEDDLPTGHLQFAVDALEAEFSASPGATPYRAGKARASRT